MRRRRHSGNESALRSRSDLRNGPAALGRLRLLRESPPPRGKPSNPSCPFYPHSSYSRSFPISPVLLRPRERHAFGAATGTDSVQVARVGDLQSTIIAWSSCPTLLQWMDLAHHSREAEVRSPPCFPPASSRLARLSICPSSRARVDPKRLELLDLQWDRCASLRSFSEIPCPQLRLILNRMSAHRELAVDAHCPLLRSTRMCASRRRGQRVREVVEVYA